MNITNFKTIENIVRPSKIYNLYYFRPVRGFSLDSRSLKKGEAFIALEGKYKDGHRFIRDAVKKGTGLVIATKYIETEPKIPQFIVEDTYQALRRIIIYLRRKSGRTVFVAVTGSVGKTTTKEILEFLLKPYRKVLKSKGTENNILGVAKTMFSCLGHDAVILELGTNKKGEIFDLANLVKPDIGIITCIRPVHLVGLGSLKQIKDEKLSLFKAASGAEAILNSSDPQLIAAKIKNKIHWFGKNKKGLYFRLMKRKDNRVYFKVLDRFDLILPLHLEHYIDNYLAALSAARLFGLSYRELIARLNSFKGFFPMRMEQKQIGSYLVLNDAYNANPASFEKALLALKHFRLPKIVVAADMLELGVKTDYYHHKLASQIIRSGCQYCLTLGNFTTIVNKQLKALNYRNAFHFSSHKEIANFLKRRFKNKKCLILLKGSRSMELERVLKFL